MVYTVTLNPAVDYILYCDKITGGITNRSLDEEIRFGGKGINVSAVLTQLDTENTALGFIAGFTGDALERGIHEMGIKTDFVRLKESYTRINIKIKAQSETEINAKGPAIDEESLNKFYHKIDKIADNDILVLAGNAPQKAYTDILKRIGHKKVLTVVDTTKQQLTDILPYNPFLIKPNKQELEEIFETKVQSSATITDLAKKLQKMGARNVLVSLGKEGAMLLCENGEIIYAGNAEGKVVDTVGSGDSMVAGFIAGFIKKKDYEYAVKLGSACGNATAFSFGLANRQLIDQVFHHITVTRGMT